MTHIIILDDLQIQSIKQEAISIGVPVDVLRFNIGKQTVFVDGKLYIIVVMGDILPDINSKIARDRMSQRAVLATNTMGIIYITLQTLV